MGRKKAVSKTKSNPRKMLNDPHPQATKVGTHFKDVPERGEPLQTMEELMLQQKSSSTSCSSRAIVKLEPMSQELNSLHNKRLIESPSASSSMTNNIFQNTNSSTVSTIITPLETTSNKNVVSPPLSSSDHKYLHKKFKRIASATVDSIDNHSHKNVAKSSLSTISSMLLPLENVTQPLVVDEREKLTLSNAAINSNRENYFSHTIQGMRMVQQLPSTQTDVESISQTNRLSDTWDTPAESGIADNMGVQVHRFHMNDERIQHQPLSPQSCNNQQPYVNTQQQVERSSNRNSSKMGSYLATHSLVQHHQQQQDFKTSASQIEYALYRNSPPNQQQQTNHQRQFQQQSLQYNNDDHTSLCIKSITPIHNLTKPISLHPNEKYVQNDHENFDTSSIDFERQTSNYGTVLATDAGVQLQCPQQQPNSQHHPPPLSQHQIMQQPQQYQPPLQNHLQVEHLQFQYQQPHLGSLQQQLIQPQQHQQEPHTPGRYVCPYCQLNCTKPSVLQKHIRAHTNERPYPCVPCGFAFKTRSNLYKHCRSRAHALRLQGGDPQPDDDTSMGSDQDQDQELSSSASSDVISRATSPMDDRDSSPNQLQQAVGKPYKPKFHNASMYAKDDKLKLYNSESHESMYQSPLLHPQQHHQQQQQHHQQQQKPKQQLQQQQHNHHHHHQQQKNQQQQQQQPQQLPQQRSKPQQSISMSSAAVSTSTQAVSSIIHPLSTQNVEYLKEHISKIISQNEAIMEVVEPALQKKYHKITGISRGFVVSENSSSKLAIALLKQREETLNNLHNNNNNTNNTSNNNNTNINSNSNTNGTTIQSPTTTIPNINVPSTSGASVGRELPTLQEQAQLVLQISQNQIRQQQQESSNVHMPLNLSKSTDSIENMRKRCFSEGFQTATTTSQEVATHPQNPERSIIKDLLLSSRGLAIPSNGEGEDAVYTCPLCKIIFRSADNLKYHTQHYCQGHSNGNTQSAPISPVGSPSHKYFRSNSFNVNLPEKYNPNTLAKLASSTLKHPGKTPLSLAKLAQTHIRTGRSKTENVIINMETCPAPIPLSVAITTTSTTAVLSTASEPLNITLNQSAEPTTPTKRFVEIDAPLPSPGPLLGKTRLVDSYSQDRKTEEAIISHFSGNDLNPILPKPLQKPDSMDDANQKSPYGSKRPRFELCPIGSPPATPVFYNVTNMGESSSPNSRLLMCGGGLKIVERHQECTPRFGSSGGSIVSISPSPDSQMSDHTLLTIRSGLQSGGSIVQQSPKDTNTSQTPRYIINLTPSHQIGTHFQFPPINSITGYNPLTLPPVTIDPSCHHASQILHGGKLIPFVPGIPGPNTMSTTSTSKSSNDSILMKRGPSPTTQQHRLIPSPLSLPPALTTPPPAPIAQQQQPIPSISRQSPLTPRNIPIIKIADVDDLKSARKSASGKNGFTVNHNQQQPTIHHASVHNWTPVTKHEVKRKFNFTRIADNLSPRRLEPLIARGPQKSPEEYRYFNFEKTNLMHISTQEMRPQLTAPLHIDVSSSQPLLDSESMDQYPPLTSSDLLTPQPPPPPPPLPPPQQQQHQQKPTKFLRPSSLPLKPGTFTPKRHHGITPTANTLPLISPETPRPSKNCVQLYLNGHAYTYLGLKCSTKPFYCTVNRPQPVHFTNQHKLSIYSNWQICAESNPHPLGLTPKVAMSLYDSRQRPNRMSVARIGAICTTLHSQSLIVTPIDNYQHASKEFSDTRSQQLYSTNSSKIIASSGGMEQLAPIAAVPGGYESNDNYTYIRGRGRGRYVCSECGIRCKKPSMLKKHIRTHTDVRPYTCQHCSFSFKTKGNLTKHMKSKAHYKKCVELGLNPLPSSVDDDGIDDDIEGESLTSGDLTSTIPGDSDSDDLSDGDDGGNESSDTDESRFRLHEHEAAKCLLFLSRTPPSHSNSPNLIPGRPMTYPYADQCSAKSLVGANEMDNLAGSATRRHISFMPPVFDFSPAAIVKNDQYYSNPKLSTINGGSDRKYEDASTPIDLTKPRQDDNARKEQRSPANLSNVADLVPQVSTPASLLSSLVSITDKIPIVSVQEHSPSTVNNENVLLQTYLTERALHDSKIKQSQMHRSQQENYVVSTVPSSIIQSSSISRSSVPMPMITNDMDKSYAQLPPLSPATKLYPVNSFDAVKNSATYTNLTPRSCVSVWSSTLTITTTTTTVTSVTSSIRTEPVMSASYEKISHLPSKSTKTDKESKKSELSNFDNNHSGMDTLAEIAASSVKLDTSSVLSQTHDNRTVPSSILATEQQSAAGPPQMALLVGKSAKKVASEYLKRTSAEYMKAHASSNKSDREDSGDDGSDSECDLEGAPTRSSSKPPTDFIGVLARTVVVGEDGFKSNATGSADLSVLHARGFIQEDGRSVCSVCSKTFPKKHQMILHMNIHYMERKFRCEPCSVSFRTQGHLQKHERSDGHKTKVLMTSTFGVPTTKNPRPFECSDCKIAFRIHGHLAKHLRSKTHVQKLECLQKLPFGTYAEIERAGISLTDIDTTDCDNSLASLKILAQKLLETDPSKMGIWGGEVNEDNTGNVTAKTQSSVRCNHHHSTSESRESNSDDGGEPICSADDESSYAEPPAESRKRKFVYSGVVEGSADCSGDSGGNIAAATDADVGDNGGIGDDAGVTAGGRTAAESVEKRPKISSDRQCQI